MTPKDDVPDPDENGNYWFCPDCGLPMIVDTDGAFCESCNIYYEWDELIEREDD